MSVSQRLRESFVVFVWRPVWADLVWFDHGFDLDAESECGWSHDVDIKRSNGLQSGSGGVLGKLRIRHD